MSTQRGFTVAELIVALLITGVLATVLAFVIQQMVTVPEKGSAQVEASHTMQDVISTISYDIVGAKTAVAGSNLTLTMPDYSVITYYRSGNELKRSVDGDVEIIARNISSLSFSISNYVVSMNIVSAPENRWGISENCTYRIAMRYSG